jgi:pantoate--beta-alanine ligase
MEIFRDIASVRQNVKNARQSGHTIGLVPTMGYLHEGHLSLLRQAREDNQFVILSIFVNPLQFGVGEDYEEYPRDLTGDAAQAEKTGCDLIFAPTVKEMYPQGYSTYVDVEKLTDGLCGASRPGHFRGVTTVVAKLFNIITPDRTYFGQKDAQQAMVIQKMARDLNMDLDVNIMPIIREEDGLAMSSRNAYLSTEERKAAFILNRTLIKAAAQIKNGERDATTIRAQIFEAISAEPLAAIDYISIVNAAELTDVIKIKGPTLIALAARFGKTRLIDNIIVEV